MRAKKSVWAMIEAPAMGIAIMLLAVVCFIIALWVITILARIFLMG